MPIGENLNLPYSDFQSREFVARNSMALVSSVSRTSIVESDNADIKQPVFQVKD
jgi:hypothetical protein